MWLPMVMANVAMLCDLLVLHQSDFDDPYFWTTPMPLGNIPISIALVGYSALLMFPGAYNAVSGKLSGSLLSRPQIGEFRAVLSSSQNKIRLVCDSQGTGVIIKSARSIRGA
jgi:hypothetical protein